MDILIFFWADVSPVDGLAFGVGCSYVDDDALLAEVDAAGLLPPNF